MSFLMFYLISVFVSVIVQPLFITCKLKGDKECAENPRCYCNNKLTYFEAVMLLVSIVIPFVNIIGSLIILTVLLINNLDYPIIKEKQHGK